MKKLTLARSRTQDPAYPAQVRYRYATGAVAYPEFLSYISFHLLKLTSSGAPKGGLMANSDLSHAAPQGGREPPQEKTSVVSTRRRVPTNRLSGRTLQPSIESVVANSFVPSDFLVDGHVGGLGNEHPLLTMNFVSTWILPLHVVSSTLKRKSSSAVMDEIQGRRRFCR